MTTGTQCQISKPAPPPPSFTSVRANLLQRKCACGGTPGVDGECAECRAKRLAARPQDVGATQTSGVPPVVGEVLRAPGQQLDPATRAFMEPRLGHDFSQVRVHTDSRAGESARAVSALAYTMGNHLVFGNGQYQPGTHVGQHLIAHELTHVVQQSAGRTASSTSAPTRINDDAAQEQEAESVATQIVNGQRAGMVGAAPPAVQRAKEPYISNVAVDLTAQKAALTWKGTAPANAPGTDSFTVTTGKGYSDPGDEPGTCTRDCCSGADTQCAPPYDEPKRIGACCTPIGTFYTGVPRRKHNGWDYWTPVEPVHTKYRRGIALHQHTEVTGQAIGHGCIRMEKDNAKRIYDYARGAETKVTIGGKATVYCGKERQCGTTTGSTSGETGQMEEMGDSGTSTAALTRPDAENPGPGGDEPGTPGAGAEEELV